jgi:uncharacterized protein (PEP-CTERM system associated)
LLLLTATSVARSQDAPAPAQAGTTQYSTPGTTQPATAAARDATTPIETRSLTRPWRFRPTVSVRETYNDNVFPDSPTPAADFVTQVTPDLRFDGRSPRLDASIAYTPTAILYARNSESNDLLNNLSAYANLETIERFFFIEASGYITQGFISPLAPRPTDITAVTQNRQETSTASLSPYVRHLGPDLDYELRNRNTWTDSGASALGKFRTERWTGRVAAPVRRFGWSLEFDDSVITHYDTLINRPEDKARLYRGRLYYQPDPELRLSVSGGSEQNNYVLQEVRTTTIYGGGLAWRPGPRTSADLEYENRFFGPYKLARFSHRTRFTAWNLSYTRNVTTYQDEVLRLAPGDTTALLDAAFAGRIPDPEQRRAAVEQFQRTTGTPAFLSTPIAFYTQQVYLQEGVNASFAILGLRNSITFTAFAGENSQISADALGILPDALFTARVIKQRGFATYVEHKLAPLTTLSARASRIDSREEPTGSAKNDYFDVMVTHQASPKTTVFTGVAISRFDSTSLTPHWDSNSVFVGLNHRFY